jgi:Mrp family chromosome partitioning ATPase
VRITPKSRFAFNNTPSFLKCLREDFDDYDRVVLDLPPAAQFADDQINPAAPAAACDALFLVCVRGRVTEAKLQSAVDLIRSAGGALTGAVLNEFNAFTPGQELARISRRLFRRRPYLAERLAARALASEFLNS